MRYSGGGGESRVLSGSFPDDEERGAVSALRSGDEIAFLAVVRRYYSTMIRIAMGYVSDRSLAEDVVQETWLAVYRGIGRFRGQSSLKTWIIRILINCAKTRGARERRFVHYSGSDDGEEGFLEPARFLPADHDRWPHHWAIPPTPWCIPEEEVLSRELRRVIEDAIRDLPSLQRDVISLRDVEGHNSVEVCNILHISASNQRVLLHRARSRVRSSIERYFCGE